MLKKIFPKGYRIFGQTLFVMAIFFLGLQKLSASHLMGAEMYYDCVGANQYRISLVIYRDCQGLTPGVTQNVSINRCGTPSSQSLSLVSGYPQDVSNLCPTTLSNCSGGSFNGVDKWLYQAVVTFPSGCNNIKVSYSHCCWLGTIVNLSNPSSQSVFTEMIIDNTLSACNNSSRFQNNPNLSACNNQPFHYSFAANDADSDSLVYALVNCQTASGTSASYNVPFSGTNPLSATGLSFDTRTGQLSFTPTAVQTAVLCVRVDEYRNGLKIAEQTRVALIQVLNCTNSLPRLSALNLAGTAQQANYDYNFCVSNNPVCFDMIAYDANAADSVFAAWNNSIAGATFTTQRISNDSVRATFCFTPSSAGLKTFTVKVNDNACPKIGQNIYTYKLNVGAGLPVTVANASTSCAGSSDATLTANVSGGTGAISYLWSVGSIGQSVNGLGAGTYCVTVVDALGCSGITCATVTQPSLLTASIQNLNNVQCNGQANASMTILPSGGTAPYLFIWSNGQTTTNNTTTGLSAGVFCVTVVDANNCSAVNCATITQPSQITVSLNSQQMTCALNDASASVVVTGGTPAYSFLWSGPNNFQATTANLSSIADGSYLLLVTDANGCVASETTVIDSFIISYFNQDLLVSDDSTLNITVNVPTASVAQYSALNPQNGTLTYLNAGSYEYVPTSAAQVFDTITVRHCNATEAYETNIILGITSCVWSGDSDTNQIVNNFDLLPIGLNYGSADNPRPNAGTDWDCEPMTDWANIAGQPNPKHADTNGDGFIDNNDTLAIALNWGSFYLRNLTNTSGAAPLYLDTATVAPGDTVRLDVLLGNALQSAANVYGIAFTVNYDNSIVDTNSVRMKYDNSWLGTKDLDMLALSKDFYFQGRTEVALVRTDHTGRSNSGAIAHIQFTIKDDVLKSTNLRLNLSISNVRMIDSAAVELPVSPLPSSVLILPTPTSVNSFENDNEVSIFPNPATDLITVSSLYPIDEMKIISIDSKEIQLDKTQNTINVSLLSPGLYCILIESKGKQIIKKFIKK
jgi:hypothetical protein